MAADKQVPVIIETPKGSTLKYDFDVDHQCFKLNKVMPAGMVFPYDLFREQKEKTATPWM